VDHIVFAHNGLTVMTTSNKFDNLNRLTGISSASSASSVVNFQYQYNLAGQRTWVSLPDGSYWINGYDALGQLTSAKKYFWDGTPYAGQQFGFGFDTIGNRLSTQTGGDSTGANLRQASYTNNALNQITSRGIRGQAIDWCICYRQRGRTVALSIPPPSSRLGRLIPLFKSCATNGPDSPKPL
jgi:hypothetical protein